MCKRNVRNFEPLKSDSNKLTTKCLPFIGNTVQNHLDDTFSQSLVFVCSQILIYVLLGNSFNIQQSARYMVTICVFVHLRFQFYYTITMMFHSSHNSQLFRTHTPKTKLNQREREKKTNTHKTKGKNRFRSFSKQS